MKNKYLLAITAGHIFTDMNLGALPAMLPFIVAASGLGYARAAGLTFAVSLASTLTQPFFGIMVDKLIKSWLLPFGVLFAGCGLAMIGLFPGNYWLMFTAALISGIGVAAFHPDGARMANRMAGKEKGRSIGFFSLGGTIGTLVGPLMATPALLYLGLGGSAVLAIPAIIVCVIIIFLYPKMHSLAETMENEKEKTKTELRNEWLKFFWLSIAIVSRSVLSHSFNTFIPLYWVNELQQSKAIGGMLVSFMTFFGAIVVLLGGYLSDHFGVKKIITLGWVLLIPSVFFLTSTANPVLAMLMLVPFSIGNFLIIAPQIVLGQQYLPKSLGFASGIILGLAVSTGGLVSPLLGRYADLHGLVSTFKLLSILPIVGIVVALTSRPPAKS